MQISNLVGQYNQSISAGAEKVTGTKGVENLVSSLKSLTQGNIFEGTVSSVKNGRVTLSLSNGTSVSARLDGKISLTEGQSMFFQVKSNDGSTIAIRPFVVDGNGVNYTLMQALSAAGLPVQPNFLSMVDKMMEEQMPIDRGSLQQMARLANANGEIDVRTLVQMSKLGIELTPENAAQFENYLGDKQAITAAIDDLIDELPTAMRGSGLPEETLRQMNSQLLAVVTEGLEDAAPEAAAESKAAAAKAAGGQELPGESPLQGAPGEPLPQSAQQEAPEEVQNSAVNGQEEAQKPAAEAPAEGEAAERSETGGRPVGGNPLLLAANATAEGIALVLPAKGETAGEPAEAAESVPAEAAENSEELQNAQAEAATAKAEPETLPRQPGMAGDARMPETVLQPAEAQAAAERGTDEVRAPEPHTLAAVLDQRQLEHLNGMLKELVGQSAFRYDGTKSAAGMLNDLRELLDSKLPVDRGSLDRLITSGEFKAVVRDTLERQWTIRPEELTGSDKINKLYSKLEGHIDRIGDVLRATGQENANFAQTAADIRGNVEFMNQINQAYTYVQIPLKMSGQTASGELYVYTNKKALAEGDRELTAFLHLDMDNLGPTDISVKLLNREVSTNFYLENDAAYDLIRAHLPILEERLRAKGYNCKVSVVNENRHVNFVEDFLKKDQPSAGQLHRYSFDMRA